MQPKIVADSQFRSVELIRHLDSLGWGFCLRLPSSTHAHLPDGRTCALSDLAISRGERRYSQGGYLTAVQAYGPISIAAYWAEGEEQPWFIVTDEERASSSTLRLYSRRMLIEELFRDLEGGRFQLQQSRLYEPERLSRLKLAVCLVYL